MAFRSIKIYIQDVKSDKNILANNIISVHPEPEG